MSLQDAQDLNQMMSSTNDVPIVTPKKSKALWIVLGCVVLGVGLGIFVYQQSINSNVKPSPTPKTTVTLPKPSIEPIVIPSPQSADVSLVEPNKNPISFPKAGKLRVYYYGNGWLPLGIILKDSTGSNRFNIASGAPSTAMKILDTGFQITGPTSLSMDSYLNSNSSQLSLGWTAPVGNSCGFNGFGTMPIDAYLSFATAQAKGEPIVSVQCWADYSPNPTDTSAKDFNDYVLIWSYTPSTTTASASPSSSASATSSPSISPSPSPSIKASATPSPSPTLTPTPTPTPSARVSMPDTSNGTPVTGVFEITVGTVSVGIVFLILGLFGLLVL